MENLPNNIVLIAGFSIFAMAPFMAIMMTSYLKIVIVLYVLRNAIGLQQAPPTIAINGLAMILTLYIMAPIGTNVLDIFSSHHIDLDDVELSEMITAVTDSVQPFRVFLTKHSDKKERAFFVQTTKKIWPPEQAALVDDQHALILLPSFVLSELKSAFQIGFLVYLPFIVVDLIVSNILLSMGMMMMSPIMVSLPFKVLLFVLADGWTRLIHALVLSYQ